MTCAPEKLSKLRFIASASLETNDDMFLGNSGSGFAGIQHNRDDPRTYAVVLPYDFLYVPLDGPSSGVGCGVL